MGANPSKIKGVILKKSKQMPFYTDIKRVFEALGGRQTEFNWLITNLEYSAYRFWELEDEGLPTSKFPDPKVYDEMLDQLDQEVIWLSGEQLTKLVNSIDIQFIWAVLSGFRKEVDIDIQNLGVIPYADGNPGFWTANPTIQHPLAEVEIVCWDSTLSLMLSKNYDLINKFRSCFTDSMDLLEHNKKYGE
jgi:hypothetical protein